MIRLSKDNKLICRNAAAKMFVLFNVDNITNAEGSCKGLKGFMQRDGQLLYDF